MPKIFRWLSLYLLFSLLLLSQASGQTDTLRLIQLSDVHICNLSGYHPEFVKLREHYGNGAESLDHFLADKARQLGVQAVIITGDLVDFYEAESAYGQMLDTQIEQFAPIYDGSLIPIYLTLGNHDITSYWINDSSGRESNQLNAQRARAAWIRSLSCFHHGTYYHLSLPTGKTSYHLLFLDNGYSLGNGMYLDKTQLDWLEGQLHQFSGEPVLIFMHKYLPVTDLNKDGNSFTSKEGGLELTPETCSRGLLRLLNEYPMIKAIFCGHGHKSVREWLTLPAGHKILQTETAGFAGDPNAWRLIKLSDTGIFISSAGSERTEISVRLQ